MPAHLLRPNPILSPLLKIKIAFDESAAADDDDNSRAYVLLLLLLLLISPRWATFEPPDIGPLQKFIANKRSFEVQTAYDEAFATLTTASVTGQEVGSVWVGTPFLSTSSSTHSTWSSLFRAPLSGGSAGDPRGEHTAVEQQ